MKSHFKHNFMKIKAIKDTGLLTVGETYRLEEFYCNEKGYNIFPINSTTSVMWMPKHHIDRWIKDGYAVYVERLSYKFEDILIDKMEINYVFEKTPTFPKTQTQYNQITAFAKLTHVRAEILKNSPFGEYWEPKNGDDICYAWYNDGIKKSDIYKYQAKFALELLFPNHETLALAIEDNQELFLLYLGIEKEVANESN
ncbi:hypothetical protein AD998_01795 [bacterium 336/3]|nr:hypothetical protein AD998_01795 [bacterium 336/3]